ncbi:MAG: CotH kinase family protein [Prolixibacteraceae bacterium]
MVALTFVILSGCYEVFDYTPDTELNKGGVYINNRKVFFDDLNKIALVSVSGFDETEGVLKYNSYAQLLINGVYFENGDTCFFQNLGKNSSIPILLVLKDSGVEKKYNLQFTTLPVVQITHRYSQIPSDPRIIALFTMTAPGAAEETVEMCRIEQRGAFSEKYPKKSFSLKFYQDALSRETKKVQLLDLYQHEDWILDATYMDWANSRNIVSFNLWREMQQSALNNGRQTYLSANKGRYVELFVNQEYVGVYCLFEQVEQTYTIPMTNGYLYKAESWSPATMYTGVPDTAECKEEWASWEQKFPDTDKQSIWKPLYNYVDFVVNANDQEFTNSIDKYMVIDQAVDEFILMNLILGSDNAGKNIFLAKPSLNEPFYIGPWDMDATWGRNWQGLEKKAEGIITFKLYERLMNTNPKEYKQNLRERWYQLRQSVLTAGNIRMNFEMYYLELVSTGAADREHLRWPESLPDIHHEHSYILKFIDERLLYLDRYFEKM